MRPFYIDAAISGRVNHLTGGPQSKDGTIDLTITQRDNGEVTTAFRVQCYREGDDLITRVIDKTGKVVAKNVTRY